MFHYLAADDTSIGREDRAVYAAAYNSAEAIRAGDAWYQTFAQDAIDDDGYAKLEMPVLALGGPGYGWLKGVLSSKTTNLRVVQVENSGHFIPEEQPDFASRSLIDFFGKP
jgi:pimeloyl-ACP methyl ester carboxylesterase